MFDIGTAIEYVLVIAAGISIGGYVVKEMFVGGAYELLSHPTVRKFADGIDKIPNLKSGGGLLSRLASRFLGIDLGGLTGGGGGGEPERRPNGYDQVQLEDGRVAYVPR